MKIKQSGVYIFTESMRGTNFDNTIPKGAVFSVKKDKNGLLTSPSFSYNLNGKTMPVALLNEAI